MKLRSKIILICVMTISTSLFLISLMACIFLNRSYKNEEIMKAYQNTMSIVTDLNKTFNIDNDATNENQVEISTNTGYGKLDETELNYFFKVNTGKDNKNEYPCICTIKQTEKSETKVHEVFNNTIYSLSDIDKLEMNQYMSLATTIVDNEGKEYVVFTTKGAGYWTASFDIYYFQDISNYKKEIRQVEVFLAITSIIVALFAAIILMLLIGRVLKPLKELNESANDIANNVYDKKIDVKTKDEIGMLGENFNKMAEAVERYTKSLEESEKRKTMFMGNLTHELKTPMTAMSGYSQLLLTAKLSDEDREEALMYINDECNRLERLSKKIMYLIGMDTDNSIEMAPIHVQDLFESAAKSCAAIAKNKNLKIVINPTSMTMNGDIDLMIDVVVNLIDNAVKASKEGGIITLETENDRIVVADNGCGIPQDEQDKILEPFYMVDKSRSRKSGGAGLGLALTAAILRKHNMKIVIESEIGQGTRVILQFV